MSADDEGNDQPAKRSLAVKVLAALSALGVLSALGTLAFNSIVKVSKDAILQPLIVTVVDQTTSPNYLFPTTVSPATASTNIETDPGGGFFRAWAFNAGGIPYSNSSFQVTIRGRDPAPVVISGVHVRAVGRKPTPPGGWVNAWDGCGGVQPVRELTVDLAKDPPAQKLYVDGVEKDGAVFQVSDTNLEVFQVDLTAARELVAWVMDIQYSSAGKSGIMTIADVDGKPFQLASGGSPIVYSTIQSDNGQLQRDDAATASLSSESDLC